MICKYCGENIKSSNGTCPKCGKAVTKLEGGNGFWDMVSRQEAEPEAPVETRYEKMKKIIMIAAIALCAALLCLLLIHNIMLKAELSKCAETEAQLREHIAALENSSEYKDAAAEAISFETLPKDETKPDGFSNEPGEYLFAVKVKGDFASISWEKLVDGKYVPLKFDDEGQCPEYGLLLSEDKESGISQLIAVSLTKDSAGEYRCTVTDIQHRMINAVVELTVTDKND